MLRIRLVLGALLVVGCATGSTSSPPTTEAPSTSPSALPPATASQTPSPQSTAISTQALDGCPSGSPIEVRAFVDADPACFGSDDFEVRGWLDWPIAIEFTPPTIAPAWLFYPLPGWSAIWEAQPVGPSKDCEIDGRGCAWFYFHEDLRPGTGYAGPSRWVIVTGHLDDPAAETCHYVYPEDWPEPTSDDADAVAACQTSFVLVSLRNEP